MSASLRLEGLFRYPVKSCRGVALGRAALDAAGVRDDRRWMLVDDDGRFLSQRAHPRLCLVRPTLVDGSMVLEAPEMPSLEVADPAAAPDAVRAGPEPAADGGRPAEGAVGAPGDRRLEVEIWDDVTGALDAGPDAARWLSDFLGVRCRLVRHAPDAVRPVDPDHARAPDDRVAFADGYPFLLTSEDSLEALNGRLPEPLPMDRFRPNLVVAGAGPFAEDGWTTVRIGEVDFSVVKPCTRCKVTTVDQATGRVGKEPLRTLADFRRGPDGVEFGQNLIHHGTGRLEVGMEVEVVA